MAIWLAIAGIGVATDNLLLASVASGFIRSHAISKWLRTTGLVFIIQLQGLALGWMVGMIVDRWFGSIAHWVAIGFIMSMGAKILFEAISVGKLIGRFALTTQAILDAALGTAIYTFIYGQSANMLHATFVGSMELVSAAALLCIMGGLLLAERYRIVWVVRMAGGITVCVSALLLLIRELWGA